MPHIIPAESGDSTRIWWNPQEFKMAERPAKITILGVTCSGGISKAIPELRLECSPELNGMECDWNEK